MKNNFETGADPSIDPISVVMGIRAEAMAMGANDYENSAFNNILIKFRAGKISAEEAISEAQSIRNSKQDYH